MKKIYRTPAIEAIKVHATEILAGSITEDASGNISGQPEGNFPDNGIVNSKSGDFDFTLE